MTIMTKPLLHSLGVGYWHSPTHVIDRPHGFGHYVFLHFLAPTEVRLRDGVRVVPTGTCVLYGPTDPQWFRGHRTGLGNDWFHADGPVFRRLVARHGVPLSTAMRLRRTEFMAPLLTEIREEALRAETSGDERAVKLLLDWLFLKLARQLAEANEPALTPRRAELRDQFLSLRFRMRKQLGQAWTVGTLAAAVHLSPTRFAALYREFFGVSPLADLLNARVDHARWLLAGSNLTVAAAARQSGFRCIAYFSRAFRQRVGVPPVTIARGSGVAVDKDGLRY
jgi:AraC-like DNA-binding protein